MSRHLRRSSGFSLIELLIVVAIIAALVGVAVPFFQDNLAEAQRTKAAEDLEIIRKAVTLYEQKAGKRLFGTSLQPLLGRYLQELPQDPWGNPYLYEGAVGFLGTYGADAMPGGSGGDQDIVLGGASGAGINFTIMPVIMRRVQYQGPWGRVSAPSAPSEYHDGSKLIVTFTRPLSEDDPTQTHSDFKLLDYQLLNAAGIPAVAFLSDPTSWVAGTWTSAGDPAVWGAAIDPLHKPHEGVFGLRVNADNRTTPTATAIRPSSRLQNRGSGDVPAGIQTLSTTYSPGADPASPLDPTVYGAGVTEFEPLVVSTPDDIAGGLYGIKIERY